MHRLSSIMLLIWAWVPLLAQSPHGEELAIDCAQCHNSSGWEVNYAEVLFEHELSTGFALDGTHGRIDCRMCHESMVFDEVGTSCVECHEDVHSMSVGNDCMRCHTAESWLVDEIPELHEENGFPLMGAHAVLSCVECHLAETNLRFDRIGNECVACHMEDYLTAEHPNHQTAGYSTQCTDCHSPLGFDWSADPISHDFFPLVQGHEIVDCNQCHTTGDFTGTSPECISCHQADFEQALNPPHTSLGFPTDCDMCHTLEPGWRPATFPIHDEYYVLRGAHAEIANQCTECHLNGNYANTPNTCFGCHEDDFNDADDPDHLALGFSTDCASCHNEDDWEPADFDHDGQYFPIYSGEHKGEWDACTDCHNVPTDYSIFTCFTCHLEGPTRNEHDDVRGYSYNSNECLRCHPDGSE